MNAWLATAKRNLLNKSEEKIDYNKARDEWFTTDRIEDSLDSTGVNEELPSCELCEHEDLRWQFEIKNKLNGAILRVGSTCIKQFNIKLITIDNNQLYGKDRDTKLDQLIRQKLSETKYGEVLNTMRKLWKIDTDFREKIESIGRTWKDKKSLTPNMAALLIWRLKENKLPYQAKDIKISIRKLEHKLQLQKMEKWRFETIFPCLTKAQKESLGI